MQVQVHVQGSSHSEWMDEFINKKVAKLKKYLPQSANIQVNIKNENLISVANIAIRNGNNRDYAFSGEGENVYESVSAAVDKANRGLSENKRKFKDRINRRYSMSIRKLSAA